MTGLKRVPERSWELLKLPDQTVVPAEVRKPPPNMVIDCVGVRYVGRPEAVSPKNCERIQTTRFVVGSPN